MTEPIPIVCDMTDAPDTPQQRLEAYARLFALGLQHTERTESGMRWRFCHSTEAEELARELAALENACCGFMTTTVTVMEDELWWDATTIDDPMAQAVLDLMRELPEHVGAAGPVSRAIPTE
ncbi:MAG: hypothetical protein ABIP21_08920 [Acidimicrobiia bacterium]